MFGKQCSKTWNIGVGTLKMDHGDVEEMVQTCRGKYCLDMGLIKAQDSECF